MPPVTTPREPDTQQPPENTPVPATRRSRRRRRRIVALVLLLLLTVPGISYEQALTAPGGGSWQARSVDWLRDHGGSSVVNAVENWWYSRQAPTGGTPEPDSLPQPAGSRSAAPANPVISGPGPVPPLPRHPAVAGEGTWIPGRPDAAGRPAIYTTFTRPDPTHASVVVGVAWMRAGASIVHLAAGTAQPGGSAWDGGAQVPDSAVPSLLSTFNSGWKFGDINGGFYLNGRTGPPLLSGQASAVIDDKGMMTIGQWGRDVSMNGHVQAVRQNLSLIVDGGKPADGLAANATGQWGSAKNQFQYTWRSGIGTDAAGNLVYVAGNGLTLQTLADAMVQIGVQRGMELDIHSNMVSFSSWTPTSTGSVTPTKLLPDMQRPADRYLAVDQRDFFYLTLR